MERYSERLAIFAIVTVLIVASVAITAYATDKQKPELTTKFKTNATNVNIPSNPNPILNSAIIWNNGGTFSGGGGYSSQWDQAYPFVSQVADDFILTDSMNVTDVHWWGLFWNGPPDYVEPCDFYIYFYADDGTGNAPTGAGMPDPSPTALRTYFFSQVSGLPLDPYGFYEYNVNLSPPFTANANVRYWIAIQAVFAFPPQFGWTNTSATQLHTAEQGFPLLGTAFWTTLSPAVDMAFYLTGEPASQYWKPSYDDYAPSGMPDFDQKQDNWTKVQTGQFTFCGSVAVANCFWWFDSKYNVPPGPAGDGMDQFPLVRDYLDQNPPLVGFDDHDPWNVNHINTPWGPAVGAPPATPQPFVPGHQAPGQVPSWGELVERLAWFLDTDGIRTGYGAFSGTKVTQMEQGIDAWLQSEHFQNQSTLADSLCEVTLKAPTFAKVESLVEKSEDVILLLGFWYENPPGSGQWFRCGGHYVTVAGVNSRDLQIAFSDPFFDNAEGGNPGRVLNGSIITHSPGHAANVHNDAGNVSHDIYPIVQPSPSPGGLWMLPTYPVSLNPGLCYDFNHQNIPDEFVNVSVPYPGGQIPLFTEVEYAIHISPWDYVWDYRGDVNIPGGDGNVNSADVTFIINYLFVHGPVPVPLSEADVNCDGNVNSADVAFLINYLFVYGPAPKCKIRVCDP